jgi:hypothetical protein
MLLYCKGGAVLGWHDDAQTVDPALYGTGVIVIPYSGELEALGRLGAAPPAGEFDPRLYAAPAITPATLVAYANWKQWALATGGYTTTIGGAARTFVTTTEGQALITGKQLRLQQAGAPASIQWQFGGNFVSIAAADFTTAAIKVADFVQATFDTLSSVSSAIGAGTITTVAQVDAAAWPAANG